MTDDENSLTNAIMAILPPLLDALDGLAAAGRHLHPPNIQALVDVLAERRGSLDDGLRTFKAVDWPDHMNLFQEHAVRAAESTLRGYERLSQSVNTANPIMTAFSAMGHATRAVEALYPLAPLLRPVSVWFLNPEQREDEALLARVDEADGDRDNVGIVHMSNGADERGGFSLYVPEYYTPDERWPLVVALHGGSGHGRDFLWTWLRDARSRSAIVLSPTSRERTWSLTGPEVDADNLMRMVEFTAKQYALDEGRILLTGMSDGGTFSWLAGLIESSSPYTHLAPISSSFHPLLLEGADAERLHNVPIYVTHGALDWMFPIDMARTARDALSAAGAKLTYREIDDLSHTYPREENARILDWLCQERTRTN